MNKLGKALTKAETIELQYFYLTNFPKEFSFLKRV